jgi:hypothetical protein
MDRETSLQWFRVLTRHIYYDVWVTQMFQSFSRQDKSCVGGFHPSFKERGFSASHPYNLPILAMKGFELIEQV